MSELDPLEDMMGQLGEFGNYQMFQHSLHLFTSFFAGLHMLSLTFTGPTPGHRCHIDEVDGKKPQFDSGYDFNETENKDLFKESKIKNYIPKVGGEFSQCERKVTSGGTTTCKSHVYQFNDYHPSSYVVQYGMVCKDRYKRALMRTIYLFGVLIGVIVLGPLADKTGRKPILCISVWLQIIVAIGSAFVTNYWAHLVVMLIYGAFASGGAYVTGFVLSMELVGVSKRTFCGTNFSAMFTFGCFLLVLTAYFVRNVMHLQIILGCYSLIMGGYWWLCDESIRWLWGNGKREEAIRLAKKAARWNKIEFVDRYSDIVDTAIPNDTNDVETSKKKDEKYGLCELLKYPVLRLRLLLVAFNWFANSIVYYGISFNTEDLSGDPYLNFFYSGLAELPGFIIVNVGVPYTGSRTLMAVTLGMGGVMCYVCAGLDKGWTVTAFSIFAKIGIAVSFTIVYNYTAELFPTVARNSAVGFCSMAARLAGMSTPMLSLLDTVYAKTPVIIFGTVAILGAIFCAFLPETLNTELPQTMLDGENFRIGDTAFNACCPNKCTKNKEPDNSPPANTEGEGDVIPASEDAPGNTHDEENNP